jgi:hypothetical protein
VYATIEAVETFVDRHYAEQLDLIDALLPRGRRARAGAAAGAARCWRPASRTKLAHRDDARARRAPGHARRPAASADPRLGRGGGRRLGRGGAGEPLGVSAPGWGARGAARPGSSLPDAELHHGLEGAWLLAGQGAGGICVHVCVQE